MITTHAHSDTQTHAHTLTLFRFPLSYFILSIAIVLPMRRKYIKYTNFHLLRFRNCEYTTTSLSRFLSLSLPFYFLLRPFALPLPSPSFLHNVYTCCVSTKRICCQADMVLCLMWLCSERALLNILGGWDPENRPTVSNSGITFTIPSNFQNAWWNIGDDSLC